MLDLGAHLGAHLGDDPVDICVHGMELAVPGRLAQFKREAIDPGGAVEKDLGC